ncbi:hypothetical protein ACFLVM_01050 [Chloroflexota bacterium]
MYTISIVIVIIVIGIVLSLVYRPRISQPRRFDMLFQFILTLLATLAGVFIAFQISNYQESQNEKELLVGLISESVCEFELEIEDVNDYYRNSNELEHRIEARPLRDIISLDVLMSTTLISKFGSSHSTFLHRTNHELREMRTSINSPIVNPSAKPALITSYIQQMSYMREILLKEMTFIQGDISDKEVEIEYNKL